MIALFFDTETTGIKKKWSDFKPALVQLGAILQDTETGRVLAEINIMNKDCGAIPPDAAAVHGIDQSVAITYGFNMATIDRLFANLISKADLVVAHNLDYDKDIVTDNMPESLAQLKDKNTFCTMDSNIFLVRAPLTAKQKEYFSKQSKPQEPFKVPSLKETYQYYFGEMFDGAHDAMADIRATQRIYTEMMKLGHYAPNNKGEMRPSKQLASAICMVKSTHK